LGAPLVPLHPLQDTAVLGLVDIDADGTPELFERAWPGTLRISAGRDPAPCQLEQGYCGCPC
jgi:hypothetical protein